VTWIFGAGASNAMSTNVWFHRYFCALVVLCDLLGAFEIMLPNLGK
jgi:thiol:disulfide interchange protein DsbD